MLRAGKQWLDQIERLFEGWASGGKPKLFGGKAAQAGKAGKAGGGTTPQRPQRGVKKDNVPSRDDGSGEFLLPRNSPTLPPTGSKRSNLSARQRQGKRSLSTVPGRRWSCRRGRPGGGETRGLDVAPVRHPELKVNTPAHTKHLGWYAEFESRVTQGLLELLHRTVQVPARAGACLPPCSPHVFTACALPSVPRSTLQSFGVGNGAMLVSAHFVALLRPCGPPRAEPGQGADTKACLQVKQAIAVMRGHMSKLSAQERHAGAKEARKRTVEAREARRVERAEKAERAAARRRQKSSPVVSPPSSPTDGRRPCCCASPAAKASEERYR